jgi:hypothetical protein
MYHPSKSVQWFNCFTLDEHVEATILVGIYLGGTVASLVGVFMLACFAEETAAPTPTLAACGIAKIAKPTGSKL